MGEVLQHLFGGIQFGTLIFWMLVVMGAGFFVFMLSLFGFCSFMIYTVYKRTKGYNCLYWKHPENTVEGVDYMELRRIYTDRELFIKDYFLKMRWPYARAYYEPREKSFFNKARENQLALYETRLKNTERCYVEQRRGYPDNAQDWDYKETWWQWWTVTVKWVYEDKQDGRFVVKPLEPDRIIQLYIEQGYPAETSREIAQELKCSQNWLVLYKKPMKWLKTLALGAPAVLGVAFVIGIIFLGVFLVGKTGGGG